MPRWDQHIDVADVFHNDSMTFWEIRDAVVARLRGSPWIADRDQSGFDELGDVVENLACADSVDEFDEWWDALYDHADRDRVWIDTF